MAKTEKRKVGDLGEEIACRYLELHGFFIIERNYLRKWGEIDIIAEKGNVLHFVEVKSVSREPSEWFSREMIRPEENMHGNKIKRLHRAIQTYLMERKVGESKLWQLDLACVYIGFEAKKSHVEMLENIILG